MAKKISIKMILGQMLFYLGLMIFIGYFAEVPEFEYLPDTHGELKLIIRHSGKLIGECTRPDPEAQQKLPRNMRVPMICPRERSPVTVRLSLDDRLVLDKSVLPAGLHNDGISAEYRNFRVEAGKVRITLVVNDSQGDQNSTYTYEREITINPSESVALEFNNGFTLYQGKNSADTNATSS
ncbi:MAG: hypothetical protein QGD92_09205 [Gammaproteobacteria bacterium]|nr:hypothetical protein [Gammaproteobacteria bacterium]